MIPMCPYNGFKHPYSPTKANLTICFINIYHQGGLSTAKQLMIEDFIIEQNVDIANLSEINVDENTFSSCRYLSTSFSIITNNARNGFGTASLVKNNLTVDSIQTDANGRFITFNICEMLTIWNVYLASGSSQSANRSREEYCGVTIPQLLLNRKGSGVGGGDFNCITDKRDASSLGVRKCKNLEELIRSFSMRDSYRQLHPRGNEFSRYAQGGIEGPSKSRIDRCYDYGKALRPIRAQYMHLPFSDHLCHLVTFEVSEPLSRSLMPRSRPIFKIKPDVIKDKIFQDRVTAASINWTDLKSKGLSNLFLWEEIIKKDIRRLAMERGKEISYERKGELNLLFLRMNFLSRALHKGDLSVLKELKTIQMQIVTWYEHESERVILQAKSDECEMHEKVRIYHHSLHSKNVKRGSILNLDTDRGLLKGHKECAKYLEDQVKNLLLNPHTYNQSSRDILLKQTPKVFTEADNVMLLVPPSQNEIYKVICSSNLLASPGTDGIPYLLYKTCWSVIKDFLTEMILDIFNGENPTPSQRRSLMVFTSKPKYLNSNKPGHKRRISLINTCFKIMTGIEAIRLNSTATHTLSPMQLVAGSDRRIHHGICRARDTVMAAGNSSQGGYLMDSDYEAGFDWLTLEWVWLVLLAKGCDNRVVDRYKRLYQGRETLVVVNNIVGESIPNIRGSLAQGDRPSMYFFASGWTPCCIC